MLSVEIRFGQKQRPTVAAAYTRWKSISPSCKSLGLAIQGRYSEFPKSSRGLAPCQPLLLHLKVEHSSSWSKKTARTPALHISILGSRMKLGTKKKGTKDVKCLLGQVPGSDYVTLTLFKNISILNWYIIIVYS